MKKSEFNKLIKEKDPNRIIFEYTESKIALTEKQLDKVIELKNQLPKRSYQDKNKIEWKKELK